MKTFAACTPNHPVNADARATAVLCIGLAVRAAYWERLGFNRTVDRQWIQIEGETNASSGNRK